jgi:ketosteroid isomerase-like protein
MNGRGLLATLVLAALCAAAGADADPTALPLSAKRVAASADECAVWRRERSFARSVEAHDARAFAAHLHPGTVFNAGAADADRGRAAVAESWSEIVEGKKLVLRWRPGIVHIGGDPAIALSRGPWILQSSRDGATTVSVGFYQTVWVRDAADGVWRVLYDAAASTPQKMADRAAAERWVADQAMADCSES